MTVPLALVTIAVLVAWVTPRLLTRLAWPRRSPRLGILAWQGAVVAVLASVVLLALTAFLPVERVRLDLSHVLHACPEGLGLRHLGIGGSWFHGLTLLAAAATLGALLRAVVVTGSAVRRGRNRQRDLVGLVGRQRDALHPVDVLDHDVPMAYCVPGGHGRVVVTTAALARLEERQLTAVLAHEHAHLDGRHDLVLFGAEVAAAAFPWSRFFRDASRELGLLVEMLADDEASRQSDRRALATALVNLGQAPSPAGTVGATGDTLTRVERLVGDTRGLPAFRRLAVLGAVVTLTVLPWLVAIAPAWAARAGPCPPGA